MPIFHRSYVAKRKRWLRAKAKPGQESIHIMILDHCQYRNMVMTCKYVQVCEGRNSKWTEHGISPQMSSKILFWVFVLFAKSSLFFHILSSYVIHITVTKAYHNTRPQTTATCLAFQDYYKQFEETLDNPGENIFCNIKLAINMSNFIAS